MQVWRSGFPVIRSLAARQLPRLGESGRSPTEFLLVHVGICPRDGVLDTGICVLVKGCNAVRKRQGIIPMGNILGLGTQFMYVFSNGLWRLSVQQGNKFVSADPVCFTTVPEFFSSSCAIDRIYWSPVACPISSLTALSLLMSQAITVKVCGAVSHRVCTASSKALRFSVPVSSSV